MADRLMLKSPHEREWEARRLADDGLGWQDLVVRLGLSEEWAKRIVTEQWHRRQHAARRAST